MACIPFMRTIGMRCLMCCASFVTGFDAIVLQKGLKRMDGQMICRTVQYFHLNGKERKGMIT